MVITPKQHSSVVCYEMYMVKELNFSCYHSLMLALF